jgi:hypothetical protein
MQFTITNQNNDLIKHLSTLDANTRNDFINNILNLGFKEFSKLNKLNTSNYNNDFQILEKNINTQFDNIHLLINEIKLENKNNLLILNKNNNKGNLGEKMIYDFFNKNHYQIEDTSENPHSGDLKLYLTDINQYVLIEIKNYKYTVDQKQIDKFYYDLEYTGIKLGIFISLQSKIVNIQFPIEWKITKNNEILIFISECSEEQLYLAIFSLITLYKNNKLIHNNYQLSNNEDLFNDIKYLALQKDNINKLKNEILNLHSSYTNSILSLYNNLCLFDNNFNYIINKIYNKLDNLLQTSGSNEYLSQKNLKNNEIYLKLDKITNNKDLLEMILSDLINKYTLELIESVNQSNIKNTKIKIINISNITIGEIKILKTTVNLILPSGLEIKNINKSNWNNIINLL